MPKLRKTLAGRNKPPTRPSPAAAPSTPATSIPVVFHPGTYTAETAAEKAAGKKPITAPAAAKTAEAPARDAAKLIAVKQEAAAKAASSQTEAAAVPRSDAGVAMIDPPHLLKTIRQDARGWYKNFVELHSQLGSHLEVRYSLVPAPGHFDG